MLGPIEIVTIGFTEPLAGKILPELTKLVESGVISIIDGLLAAKGEDGSVTLAEFSEEGGDPDAAALAALFDRVEGLVSDEDVETLVAEFEPGTSAAILVFEHTWLKPLRNSIIDSGGVLLDSVRIPGFVVEELLATVPETD
ncbi:DUF6325 family protein [Leifsonia sp. Leaf264]|uniref:DUF6325 family protein n=1 Tax=Leifsonia sp. Leaf264 TaxID=1736314 RepID=UPI0006FA4B26|nr:DUF6325 family protein [Leifsonia sp. Leaf264]KQO97788.1 hypothetical protein ASF30_15525 [Leifsonia sp. Leaf264]